MCGGLGYLGTSMFVHKIYTYVKIDWSSESDSDVYTRLELTQLETRDFWPNQWTSAIYIYNLPENHTYHPAPPATPNHDVCLYLISEL